VKPAVEMTRCGKRGKPKTGFPLFPHRLEIAYAISTFPRHDDCSSILRMLRATVTHVAGPKCYLCPRPVKTAPLRYDDVVASADQF